MRGALAFLTVLPIGSTRLAPRRATLFAFPLAGLVIGAAWAGLAAAASPLWGPLAAAALVVALDLALTGGLHADALADVADGLASRREPSRALEIMREPQIGAVGAAAVGTALLLRFAWIAVLIGGELWALIVAVPLCGRVAMVAFLSRGASDEGASLALGFSRCASPAVGAGVACLAALACLTLGALAMSGSGAALALGALAAALLVALACEHGWRRRFGSITGDATGATGMTAELAALAFMALGPAVEGW